MQARVSFWKSFLICVIGSLVLAAAGCNRTISSKTEAKQPKIPAIDAEIVAIKCSPNGSMVALFSRKKFDAETASLILFDLTKKRISKTATIRKPSYDVHLAWSPDSSHVATLHNGRLIVVGKDGSEFTMPAKSSEVEEIVWRENNPTRLLYLPLDDTTRVYEVDVATGQEKEIEIGNFLIGLFNVNGKPCVAYQEGKDNEHVITDVVYIAEVDTGRRILNLPMPLLLNITDDVTLDMSPDGQYFFLGQRVSGGYTNIIARSQDAKILDKQPHVAILYDNGVDGCFRITWPPIDGKCKYTGVGDPKRAIIEQMGLGTFIVDLFTGDIDEWPLSDYSIADFLPQEKPGDPWPGYIVVNKDGLSRLDTGRPGNLLLKHRPNSERQDEE